MVVHFLEMNASCEAIGKKKAAEYCSTVSNLMCVLIKCKEILLLVIKSLIRFKTLYLIFETFFMSVKKKVSNL